MKKGGSALTAKSLLFTLSSSIWAVRKLLESEFGMTETEANTAILLAVDAEKQISRKAKAYKQMMIEEFPYVIGQPAEIFHDGKWKKGKIVAGYRFRDGVVTIRTEGGETVWCGEARKDLYRPLKN